MKLIFQTPSGSVFEAEALAGETLMQAATNALVPGIIGECGGGCSCGTCHVHLPDEVAQQIEKTQPQSELERELLENGDDFSSKRSRLGCQITVHEGMDGILIHVPGS